jgi:hypothetical protein
MRARLHLSICLACMSCGTGTSPSASASASPHASPTPTGWKTETTITWGGHGVRIERDWATLDRRGVVDIGAKTITLRENEWVNVKLVELDGLQPPELHVKVGAGAHGNQEESFFALVDGDVKELLSVVTDEGELAIERGTIRGEISDWNQPPQAKYAAGDLWQAVAFRFDRGKQRVEWDARRARSANEALLSEARARLRVKDCWNTPDFALDALNLLFLGHLVGRATAVRRELDARCNATDSEARVTPMELDSMDRTARDAARRKPWSRPA